jgi:hypothetical protein
LPEKLLSCSQSCTHAGAFSIGRDGHNQALHAAANPLRGLAAAERGRWVVAMGTLYE